MALLLRNDKDRRGQAGSAREIYFRPRAGIFNRVERESKQKKRVPVASLPESPPAGFLRRFVGFWYGSSATLFIVTQLSSLENPFLAVSSRREGVLVFLRK